MGRTVLRARQEGVSYFLNTESSSPSTGHRNRYRLFKTTDFGRSKAGWEQVGSIAGQALIAIIDEAAQFAACAAAFDSKKPPPYERHGKIRGAPGPWEGEAFSARRSGA